MDGLRRRSSAPSSRGRARTGIGNGGRWLSETRINGIGGERSELLRILQLRKWARGAQRRGGEYAYDIAQWMQVFMLEQGMGT